MDKNLAVMSTLLKPLWEDGREETQRKGLGAEGLYESVDGVQPAPLTLRGRYCVISLL